MKKILLTALLAFTSIVLFSQANIKPLGADFKYNDASIRKALADNKLEFSLVNITNSMQLDNFLATTVYYQNDFRTALIAGGPTAEKVCQITFLNNKIAMGSLLRLFVSNNIQEVTFDGKKMTTENFFKQFSN